MNNDTLTVGQLAEAIGEKPRAVQFWTEAGVLRPIAGTARGGKGTHRRYPREEVLLARLASRLAKMNSPIGEIIDVIGKIREYKEIPPSEAFRILAENCKSAADQAVREGRGDELMGLPMGRFLTHISEWWLLTSTATSEMYLLVIFGEGGEDDEREVAVWVNDEDWISLWGDLITYARTIMPVHAGLKLIRAEANELREIVLGRNEPGLPSDKPPVKLAASILKTFFETMEGLGINVTGIDETWARLRENAQRLGD